jgi:NAD-dependent histone deacetylase SIR2
LSKKPDLLIVMGTSLKVHGLKKLVKEFAKAVHQRSAPTAVNSTQSRRTKSEPCLSSLVDGNVGKVIFVNKTSPSGEWGGVIDYHIEGTTDEWAERVLADWKKMRPADWEVQATLADANCRGRHAKVKKGFIVVKPVVTSAAKPRGELTPSIHLLLR